MQSSAKLTAASWPIAASLLPFAAAHPEESGWSGGLEREWSKVFAEVSEAGFTAVDLTDTWVRFGDLSPEQLTGLAGVLVTSDLSAPSISIVRRSVIDAMEGDGNLAYCHRSLDVAAALGAGVVSVGLHQALTAEQRGRLWFWTAPGYRDPLDDPDARSLVVRRFRELGRHAADLGILLSLELYEHTYLGTAESSVRLIEEIDLDVVGLNPDLGNLVRLHEPIEDWRAMHEATLPYANFWHLKNYTRDEDLDAGFVSTVPSYLENGVINYRWAVRHAIESGFRGVLCVEHYGGDGLSMSAANRDYLRRVLPRDPEFGESRVRQQFDEIGVTAGGGQR